MYHTTVDAQENSKITRHTASQHEVDPSVHCYVWTDGNKCMPRRHEIQSVWNACRMLLCSAAIINLVSRQETYSRVLFCGLQTQNSVKLCFVFQVHRTELHSLACHVGSLHKQLLAAITACLQKTTLLPNDAS